MSDAYRTIVKEGTALIRDRGSKFYAYAFGCASEEQLKQRIEALKSEFPTARHFCYGWIAPPDQEMERSNDAGEPAGTAGLPILNQIHSASLHATAVVVVRIFGGTKLGKTGLIQAYKEGAQEAIGAAVIKTRYLSEHITIHYSYDQTTAVRSVIENINHCRVIDEQFAERCTMHVAIPQSQVANALHSLQNLRDVEFSQ